MHLSNGVPSYWRHRFLVALTAAGVATSVAGAQGGSLQVLGYVGTVPTDWLSRAPSSSMRLAEFVIPERSGAPGSEIVVYFFGTGQGGSVDANVDRWRSQFSNPAGGAVFERITRDTTAAFPITIAEWRGTYARGIGTGSSSGDARPDHTLVAAIAETPRGTLFFQLFGPSGAVAATQERYLQVVRSLK